MDERSGILVATNDGGRIWHDIGHLPVGSVPLQSVDPTHGWCATSGVAAGSEVIGLYRTVDGGLHWREVSVTGSTTATPGSLSFGCENAITFTRSTVGWVGLTCPGYVDHLYKTTDAGARWVDRDRPGPRETEGFESLWLAYRSLPRQLPVQP